MPGYLANAGARSRIYPQLRFCFLSGRSADPEEQQKALFARIKGRAERQLAELGRPAFFFRPAYIRPTALSGPRKDFARFFTPIGTLLSLLSKDFSVDCDQLARCMLGVAQHGSNATVLENRAIRAWQA